MLNSSVARESSLTVYTSSVSVSVVTKLRRSVSGCNPSPIDDSGFLHPAIKTTQHKPTSEAVLNLKKCFIDCRWCLINP